MYTGNLYLVLWAMIMIWWALISFVIYKKSSPKTRAVNVGVWVASGILIAFLAFATNPIRNDGTAASRSEVNFSVPSASSREAPERIFVEPQLTDERRRETHDSLREAARTREFFEFGEVLGHEDEAGTEDEIEETEAENKGD